MKNLILKAILKGINEGLANFDMDDYEDDESPIASKKVIYNDKDSVLRIKYAKQMEDIMAKPKPEITPEDILNCIDWHNEFGILYNPHLDGGDFRKFLYKIINIGSTEVNLNWIDTSEVTKMNELFLSAAFNGDISEWNTSNVIDMNNMFCGNKKFNQPIGNWDVSNVRDMEGMFWGANTFNKDISGWNVSNVRNMNLMFAAAKSFNQDISDWPIMDNISVVDMFAGCGISAENKPFVE